MEILIKFSLMAILGLAQANRHAATCFDMNPKIRSAADIPPLSKCTTFPNNLIIGASFSGPLTLPGVHLIGNSLVADPEYGGMLFGVTEIDLPDLVVVVEGIELGGGMPALRRLSLPKLKSLADGAQAGNPSPMWTRVVQTAGGGTVQAMNLSFPELEEVGNVYFEGSFEAVDFPKLRKARSMIIKSTADLDCNAVLKQLEKVEFGREDTLECHSSVNIEEAVMNAHGDNCTQFPLGDSNREGKNLVATAVEWVIQATLSLGRSIFFV